MPLLPQALDTRLGRCFARRLFPEPSSSDLGFPAANSLSEEELRFFACNGYLVRNGVIPAELLGHAEDFAWSLCPAHFDREDPQTWRGRVHDSLGHASLRRRHGRLHFRDELRAEWWLCQLLANNVAVTAAAEGLIGANALLKPERASSLVMGFPGPRNSHRRPRPRTGGRPCLLGVTAYLHEVEAGGGGFTVWPGSHFSMRWAYHHAAGPCRANDYQQRLYGLAQDERAVEITGAAGTVIFWHHRLAHGFNSNHSKQPSVSVTVDFSSLHIDRLLRQPPPLDPWQDWEVTGGLCVSG